MSYQTIKKIVRTYFDELEECNENSISEILQKYMSETYTFEGPYPFMDIKGTDNVSENFWNPIKKALYKMQRRQDVFMAGTGVLGGEWVMSMGYFVGVFKEPLLGIAPTNRIQHLQYAEFNRVENGKIVHTAMFTDLIGFMHEAGAYPLPPMTGKFYVYPGPRDHNGLMFDEQPKEKGEKSLAIVDTMVNNLQGLFAEHHSDETSAESMKESWADDMYWYGPCGIGAAYTIPTYQKQHHHPFCDNLINVSTNDINAYFAEGDFVCFYTSMEATPTGGFLGMTGGKENAHIRGDIDVYYCKDGKISENWCFIDLAYWLKEQGLDVFERHQVLHQ